VPEAVLVGSLSNLRKKKDPVELLPLLEQVVWSLDEVVLSSGDQFPAVPPVNLLLARVGALNH
jgi:hypothetical protein